LWAHRDTTFDCHIYDFKLLLKMSYECKTQIYLWVLIIFFLKKKDMHVCIIIAFCFFTIFKMFLYYQIIKPVYDSAILCKRLTESEHKNADNIPFRLANDLSECPQLWCHFFCAVPGENVEGKKNERRQGHKVSLFVSLGSCNTDICP